MTRLTAILLVILAVTTTSLSVQAQPDPSQPYIYYYSQLLGGLIIEHPDGTDSRQIAADVIPPNMSGLAGPGWSPSGKYFAAYGIPSNDDSARVPYLIDTKGQNQAGWLHNVTVTSFMQWSPNGEDILLIEGVYNPNGLRDAFFWVIDVGHNQLLADFGVNLGGSSQRSEILWNVEQGQIVFEYAADLGTLQYYRVTMHFDGTILRQPISADEFIPQTSNSNLDTDEENRISPRGTYKAQRYPIARLINTTTNQPLELPRHTQGTGCRDYLWPENEAYIITLDGTALTDGCGFPALGVTNVQMTLWRELGHCTGASPCVGWLPQQVNVNNFPLGTSKPVQLDPIKIEYAGQIQVYGIDPAVAHILNFHCDQNMTAVLSDMRTHATLYKLNNIPCPYQPDQLPLPEKGFDVVVAEDPAHHLLATYSDWQGYGVSIWMLHDGLYEPLLKLNTQGLTLEFTDNNERLRARNFNGWKIYSVADILATVNTPK